MGNDIEGSALAYITTTPYRFDQACDELILKHMEEMRAERVRSLSRWLSRVTNDGQIPHVEKGRVCFIPASPNPDGTMCVKVNSAGFGPIRLDLPMAGTLDLHPVGDFWANVSTHERLRLYAAIAHRTPRSRKRRTD